jgi:general secretion pathway protein C
MSDRGGWRIRVLSAVGVAALVAVAMWSAGIPNAFWFAWMMDPETAEEVPARSPTQEQTSPAPQVTENKEADQLRLFATTPGRNVNEGTAQIGPDSTNALTYAAGALLQNGATVKEVHGDHVILARGTETTALYIDGTRSTANLLANRVLLSIEKPDAPAAPGPEAPPTFTGILRAAPRFEHDSVVGFDLYPGTKVGNFARLGLVSGDLLVAIDGSPINDATSLHTALKRISEGHAVIGTVLRAGEHVEVSMDGSATKDDPTALASMHPQHP